LERGDRKRTVGNRSVTASLRRGGACTERAEVSGKRGGCPPNFQPQLQFASLAGRSSVAERRLEVGSDFFEGAPPSDETSIECIKAKVYS